MITQVNEMIDYFFLYFTQAVVAFALLTFIIIFFFKKKNNKSGSLEKYLGATLTASAIPAGLALIIISFDIERINQIDSINVYILIAGISLLIICSNSLRRTLDE